MAERIAADVAVVGGGPAGISAAVHAAEAGRSVVLLDPSPRLGGQIWRHHGRPPAVALQWRERLAGSGARLLLDTTVIDAPDAGRLLAERHGRAVSVHCERLVLATGARELFLPFSGWTLPGVIGAGAAQALRESGARFRGRRVVVAGSGPLLVAAAAGLRRAGARVVALVEQAPAARVAAFGVSLARHPGKLAEAIGYAVRLRGVLVRTGVWVREAEGDGRVERVVTSDGRRLECDVLACGFGLVPNLELARMLGCEATAERVVTDDALQTSVPRVFVAGELCGIGGAGQALVSGAIAGLAAAGARVPGALRRRLARERAFAARLSRAFALRDELRTLARPETIVCRCEDVTLARIGDVTASSEQAAARRDRGRQVKLHTRAGMGACQGRVCGPALSFLFDCAADTIRPPLVPVPLALLAESGEDGGGGLESEEER